MSYDVKINWKILFCSSAGYVKLRKLVINQFQLLNRQLLNLRCPQSTFLNGMEILKASNSTLEINAAETFLKLSLVLDCNLLSFFNKQMGENWSF